MFDICVLYPFLSPFVTLVPIRSPLPLVWVSYIAFVFFLLFVFCDCSNRCNRCKTQNQTLITYIHTSTYHQKREREREMSASTMTAQERIRQLEMQLREARNEVITLREDARQADRLNQRVLARSDTQNELRRNYNELRDVHSICYRELQDTKKQVEDEQKATMDVQRQLLRVRGEMHRVEKRRKTYKSGYKRVSEEIVDVYVENELFRDEILDMRNRLRDAEATVDNLVATITQQDRLLSIQEEHLLEYRAIVFSSEANHAC